MKSLRVLLLLGIISFTFTTATLAVTATSSGQPPLPNKNTPFPIITAPSSTSASTSTLGQTIPDANSCFAYYKFGSVSTSIESQTPITTVGVPLQLNAVITNNNDYPIVDGAVYVKIFKNRPNGQLINGPAVVDQFFATDTINLAAHATTSLNFVYTIPAYAETGEYQIGTYFTASKKFNLSGLSFTDDVVGSQWSFSVRGGKSSVVEFDKDNVTVASTTYYFASYPPTLPQNEPILVEAPIVNSTDNGEIVTVDWTVYSWDGQLDSNIISTSTQFIAVNPRSSAIASVLVTNISHPVYLAVGTLHYRDTSSIVNVRFVRQGVDQARLNFPAVTSFPLMAGATSTLFSCLYNSGLSDLIPPHTLDLSLTDSSGNTIYHYSITEPITGAMMLAKAVFTPKNSYDNFTLNATLKDIHGTVVDQVSIPYSCKAINPKLCFSGVSGGWASTLMFLLYGALLIAAVFVLILLTARVRDRGRKR